MLLFADPANLMIISLKIKSGVLIYTPDPGNLSYLSRDEQDENAKK